MSTPDPPPPNTLRRGRITGVRVVAEYGFSIGINEIPRKSNSASANFQRIEILVNGKPHKADLQLLNSGGSMHIAVQGWRLVIAEITGLAADSEQAVCVEILAHGISTPITSWRTESVDTLMAARNMIL